MTNWLKKYFIPHAENGHKPHFFRNKVVGALALLIVGFELLYLVSIFVILPSSGFLASVLSGVVVNFTNENRQTSNLPALQANPVLASAAQMKANDMATKGYFAHVAPDGTEPWSWFDRAGYNYIYAGENLAINFYDSKDVVNAWMNSPMHRANILKNNFTDIGVGIARGQYKGADATFIVQFFGSTGETPIVATTTLATTVGTSTITASSSAVLGATASVTPGNNVRGTSTARFGEGFLTKVIANLRNWVDDVYSVLATIVFLALLLAIFIKIRIQYREVIINGLILLLLIFAIVFFNQMLSRYGRIDVDNANIAVTTRR